MAAAPTTTEKIALRLRELRGALSVRELSRRSGVPPESVSRSLRGLTEPTVSTLAKLCAALGTDLPTFFDFARKQTEPRKKLDDSERIVLAVLRGLTSPRRKQVARAISLLLAEEPADDVDSREDHENVKPLPAGTAGPKALPPRSKAPAKDE